MSAMNKMLIKEYNYKFNNKIHKYTIEINTDEFIPGADSLAYLNNPETCIASIDIYDYKIIFKPTATSLIVHEDTEETYIDSIPEFLLHLLDINAELNLNNLGYIIEMRNHFEYILCKKEGDLYIEHTLDFHKDIQVLDSSVDSFLEELKTMAIFFIQGDYLDSIQDIYEDEGYLPPLASDDFDSFCDYNIYDGKYEPEEFLFC